MHKTRLERAEALLASIQKPFDAPIVGEGNGASISGVRVGETADGGIGLFATAKDPWFSCPGVVAMSAQQAPDIFREICVDDAHTVMLFLLNCQRLGRDCFWHPYIDSLPSHEEIVPLLPAFWPEDEQDLLLTGTPLATQARSAFAALRQFHETVVSRRLSMSWRERWLQDSCTEDFPAEAFSFERLSWAYAIWHSRAINLPLHGGPRPCLVPLLDLMNHANGQPSTVTLEPRPSSPGSSSGDERGRQDLFVWKDARNSDVGDELFLNYGAKGNGELLRDHGFVLKDNPADVYELELPAHPIGGFDIQLDRSLTEQHKRRFFLCRGGSSGCSLPPLLLPTARIIVAQEGDELNRALKAYKSEGGTSAGGSEGGGAAFDWSLVDWTADDPFKAANDAVARGAPLPCGLPCENRAVGWLGRLLNEKLQELPKIAAAADNEDAALRTRRREAARVYVAGLRDVLNDALGEIHRLQEALIERASSGKRVPKRTREIQLAAEKRLMREGGPL